MLPNAKHAPAAVAEGACHLLVAPAVAPELHQPIATIGSRFSSMQRTAVPKAAVHKNSKPMFAENKVRFAGKRLMPPPASDAAVPENSGKFQFSVFVSL